MPLNPNHARMRSVGFDAEALDAVERAMAATLAPERQAAMRRDEEARQRQLIRDELDKLRSLADRVEGGSHGPEGKEVARRILAGGRTDASLRELQAAIRRLR